MPLVGEGRYVRGMNICARLVIHNHEQLTDKELRQLKRWLTKAVPEIAKYKRGELSKQFRQTLYKE